MIRDVLCNEVPLILRDSRPYATCAFVGCWLYVLLDYVNFDTVYSVLFATGSFCWRGSRRSASTCACRISGFWRGVSMAPIGAACRFAPRSLVVMLNGLGRPQQPSNRRR